MKRLAYLMMALLGLANPARAYVDATPTLSRLIQDATHIAVMRVVQVDRQKRVIIYAWVADLKGRLEQAEVKHRLTDGLHPREPETILGWAQPGQVAVFFMGNKIAEVCIGRYWYECAQQESAWWSMTRGRGELSLAYHGSALRLRHHVPAILAGRDAMIPVVLHGGRWQGYESVGFGQAMTGSDVPVGWIRANLAMPDRAGEVTNDPQFLAGQSGSKEELPALREALHDSSSVVRAEAAEIIGQLGRHARAALPALKQALADQDMVVRIKAAGAVLRLDPGYEPALALLLEELNDANMVHRIAAVETIGVVGAPAKKAVGPLIGLMKNNDPTLRRAAAEALGQFGSDAETAVPTLVEALKDTQTRRIAVEVLGRLGAPGKPALPQLALYCQDPDRKLAWLAAVSVIRIEAGEPESAAIRAAVPLFIEGLRNPDPTSRWHAVWCLKWLGAEAKSGVPALISLTQEKDAGTCMAAMEALGEIGAGARAALPAVRGRLTDADGAVRLVAAEALWRIDHDVGTAIAVCSAALKDGDSPRKMQALQFLADMGAEAKGAVEAILGALKSENRAVRWAAATALAMAGPAAKTHVAELTRALESGDPHVRMRVAELLGKLTPESRVAEPNLIAALKDEKVEVRIAAAGALVDIAPETPGLAAVLIRSVHESESGRRAGAILLLGQLGNAGLSAVPELRRHLNDEDPDVSDAAAAALKRLGAADPAPAKSKAAPTINAKDAKATLTPPQAPIAAPEPMPASADADSQRVYAVAGTVLVAVVVVVAVVMGLLFRSRKTPDAKK
jgi:HEAT repeat protein